VTGQQFGGLHGDEGEPPVFNKHTKQQDRPWAGPVVPIRYPALSARRYWTWPLRPVLRRTTPWLRVANAPGGCHRRRPTSGPEGEVVNLLRFLPGYPPIFQFSSSKSTTW